MQTVNNTNNMAAYKASEVRRKQQALSRSSMRGEGAMQGTQANQGLKTKTGS
jgi:hypothetical protein